MAYTHSIHSTSSSEVRYLNPVAVEIKKKKYCRFKKSGIKYIDYKDAEFLKRFLNEQGRLLPRRITGTSLKFQRKVSQAVKRARHLALLPYVADLMK
ncbi:MAG: 30S ribosomal protein S18 [Prevotellaceae bacterium]|jgi:small subunit ribosomal protein S18|nr:30S ribosomal protein S18 [Prevotellaceae bacterium]